MNLLLVLTTAMSLLAANPVECVVGGCSSQLCLERKEAKNTVSTCEWTEEYGCYKTTSTCEIQLGGKCGWTPTPALQACISKARGNKF